MDNFITGERRKHLAFISKSKISLLLTMMLQSLLRLKEILDYIFHFASPASPIDYLKNPNTNLKGWITRDS